MLPLTSTVTVSEDLVTFFNTAEARGHGGWQSLLRKIQRGLEQSNVLLLTSTDLKRIAGYIGKYGTGGYQRRLRELLQQWAEQHHLPPKKKRKLSPDERLVVHAIQPMMKTLFTRTHYKVLASVLAEERAAMGPAAERVCMRFVTVFAEDNPNFDAKRWRQLCGLTG